MPCTQQHPIGFIVLCENIQNGRICRNPEQRIHASVNHLMVQCVRPTTKIFTDFTSIDFEAVKIGCLCTARYGKMDFCTLLYVLYAFFHVLSKYFGFCRRLFLYFAVKHLTENTSVERISGMELKTAVQSVRRVQQI